MRNVSVKVLIAAGALSILGPLACRADFYQPGMAWVYDSPQSLYVVRMVERSGCYFAMYSRDPKLGEAGYCKLLTNGPEIMVDLTFEGAFPNGLAVTGLKQLRLVYLSDRDVVISTSTVPSMTFVRMPSVEALRLMSERK